MLKVILIGEGSLSRICLFCCFHVSKPWLLFHGDVGVIGEVLLYSVCVGRNGNCVFRGIEDLGRVFFVVVWS